MTSTTTNPAAAPTQTRFPWRAIARTTCQVALASAAVMPELVHDAGWSTAGPVVGGVLVISAAVTKLMSMPAVESALRGSRATSWLAAAPARDEAVVAFAATELAHLRAAAGSGRTSPVALSLPEPVAAPVVPAQRATSTAATSTGAVGITTSAMSVVPAKPTA